MEKKNGLEKCKEFWDLSGRVPVAKYPIPCPSCRKEDTIPRRYRFTQIEKSTSRYRCTVYYKCQTCSMGYKSYNPKSPRRGDWWHGVVIPKEMYDKVVPPEVDNNGREYHWSEFPEVFDQINNVRREHAQPILIRKHLVIKEIMDNNNLEE
jgi:hypothetical protein